MNGIYRWHSIGFPKSEIWVQIHDNNNGMCSEFKHTIFCALSLNHLWAKIEKIHKISRQDYNIATSTLVRNYNIIIHKILCSSQNSIFKIQIHNILCIKSKSPLGSDRENA